jgi:hypothetical protein
MGTRKQRGGSNSTVIIIEPRITKQRALEFLVKNILASLRWRVIVFYGTRNHQAIEGFIKTLPLSDQNRITLKPLHMANLTEAAYNKLMMSRTILDQIPTEMFLVIQIDAVICAPHLLEKFMKYDYVGAPWKLGGIGNGGLSLRRKSVMLKILEKCPTLNHNEDGFFGGGCDAIRPKVPTSEKAEEFSVETIYRGKPSFGIHKAWHHMPENTASLDAICPNYKSSREVNLF